jgi:N-acetyl sugar amidotransferase
MLGNATKGLPEKVVFCKKCVISNQRPSSTVEFENSLVSNKETIGFDESGICAACRYGELKNVEIDWSTREAQLIELLNQHRRSDGNYDVIVPGSGGKDSAFTAHLLKYKYKMNPLTVTWAPHQFTEIGWENFQNWIHVGGLDNVLYTPNGRLHRYLTRKAFENLLHPFQPFIVGQKLVGPKTAINFKVPLVMYGENQAEYGNSIDENNDPRMQRKFFSRNDKTSPVLGGMTVEEILERTDFTIGDFAPYIAPTLETVIESKVEVHYLGYYLKWDPQECFYYASKNTGFQPNDQRTEGSYSKYSSIDDKVDTFHYYTTLIKFGLGRASYDAAQEIRNGKITREEGVALVKKYDTEFPSRYFKDFLGYIGISEKEFHEIIDSFRSPHLWRKQNGNWELRKAAWHEEVGLIN